MLKYLKINYQTLLLIIVFFALGAFCLLLSGKNFIRIFSYLAGIYLFLSGLAMIVFSVRYHEYLQEGRFFDRSVGYFTYGILLFIFALAVILFPEYLVRAFAGIALLIFPLVRLIQASDKGRYFRYNFWKFIVGIIFIVAADAVIGILFDFLGIAFIGLGIIFIVLLIKNYSNQDCPNLFTKYIVYLVKHQNKE